MVPKGERRGFARLLTYVGRHRWRFVAGLALVPCFAAINLYIPQIYRGALEALERLSSGEDDLASTPGFWLRTAGTIAGLWLLYSTLRLTARYLQVGLSRLVEEELRNDLFAHLARLPARFFDQARIGDLVSRSTQDCELLRFMAGPTIFFGLQMLIAGPGALILIMSISPALGLTVCALFGLVGFGLSFAFRHLSKQSRVVQDAQADVAAKSQEDFSGIRVVHAFAREPAEVRAFADLADACLDSQVDMAKSRALLHSTFVTGGLLSPLAVIVVGLIEGLPKSQLFTAFLYMQMLVWPLMVCAWILQMWHRARAAADRLDEIFDVQPEIVAETSVEMTAPQVAPAVEARGLSFRYEATAPLALEDVSFEIGAGKVLGIVGPIGSGKSTVVSLLTRLYEPPRGKLFVGGVDVRDLSVDELRAKVAIAPQEPFLFSDTLRSNVMFGGDSAADADLEAVIADAGLTADLEEFPDRIDQLVGERGVSLSGGQKQRASLARALIAKRGILVLDDTLSAVDHTTEQHILESLRARALGQTTIVIAHRLDAVQHADLILVLELGRVADQGTHDELLGHGGWYAKTWSQQQQDRAG